MDARRGRIIAQASAHERLTFRYCGAVETFAIFRQGARASARHTARFPSDHPPTCRAGLEDEEMSDSNDDLKLIREIVAHGGRRYTAGNVDRSRYQRLVDLGWLISFVTNASDVEYVASDRGKEAAKLG